MSSIFISHSSVDNKAAQHLKRLLESWGHAVFLDLEGLVAGADWEEELYYQLRTCQAVVVLCSPASMDSKWVFAEGLCCK